MRNKDADQIRGNREADQCLCFRDKDCTTPLLPNSEISSLWRSSVAAQPGFCRTWSETPKTSFLTTRLNYTCLTHSSDLFVCLFYHASSQRKQNLIQLTFMKSISCLYLPTFRSQASIVSEKYTVFTFSYRKA